MTDVNRQWCVARRHEGAGLGNMSLSEDHFERRDGRIPEPADGQVVIRAYYFSPDPMNHAWVRGVPGRFEPIPVGAPMRGGIAGRIVASRHPDYKVGEAVTGFLDWADYSVSDGTDHVGVPLQRIPEGISLASGLGALGMTGLCAYLGLAYIGRPVAGDTVVVSGASGAIGSIAGQVAKLHGTRVIGTARGADKCRAVEKLGFDAVVDQSADGWEDRLGQLCPDGIDVFFDNVGAEVLDAALLNMAYGGRIVICGATAHYGGTAVIRNHTMLAVRGCSMAGFFYFDWLDRWAEGRRRLAEWVRNGEISELFDIAEGFDAVPQAALGQFRGANIGRKLIRIAVDEKEPA